MQTLVPSAAGHRPPPPPQVLLVEDDRRLAELIGDYLREHGFGVQHVARGDTASEGPAASTNRSWCCWT
ncbi:MAG: hypothetical protein GAK31_01999 [Stenotrophomonas maltophilia]|uniref:Response regulatory domain-containing protein n=1 Tax=Stenotrophomonas maltophilia TaxID=40324 RepID=A0A7V8FFF1_STEMA|nr:MAG: hypothetical protein GAK31_01999 [Stenotrophomonas maltophilia]